MNVGTALFSLFLASFLLLLATTVFLVVYRRFPFVLAVIRDVSVAEKTTGNAVIVTTWIHYEVFGKSRYRTVVFSGYKNRCGKLRAQAKQLQDSYTRNKIKYHHLPGLNRVGVLEGSITRGYLYACGLLTLIFGLLSLVTFLVSYNG